jgi:hypothetical protein
LCARKEERKKEKISKDLGKRKNGKGRLKIKVT